MLFACLNIVLAVFNSSISSGEAGSSLPAISASHSASLSRSRVSTLLISSYFTGCFLSDVSGWYGLYPLWVFDDEDPSLDKAGFFEFATRDAPISILISRKSMAPATSKARPTTKPRGRKAPNNRTSLLYFAEILRAYVILCIYSCKRSIALAVCLIHQIVILHKS